LTRRESFTAKKPIVLIDNRFARAVIGTHVLVDKNAFVDIETDSDCLSAAFDIKRRACFSF